MLKLQAFTMPIKAIDSHVLYVWALRLTIAKKQQNLVSTLHTHPSPYHQWTEAQKSPERLQIPQNKTHVPAHSRPFCKSNTHWRRAIAPTVPATYTLYFPCGRWLLAGLSPINRGFHVTPQKHCLWQLLQTPQVVPKRHKLNVYDQSIKKYLKIILKSFRVWRCCGVRKWRRAWGMEREEEIMIIAMAVVLCCLLVWLFWVRIYMVAARYKRISKEY